VKAKIVLSVLVVVAVLSVAYFIYYQNDLDCVRGSGKVVSQERTAPGLTELSVSGPISVHLVAGPSGSITVEAEDNVIDHVQTISENGALSIRLAEVCLRGFKPVVVRVPAEGISSITASKAAKITSEAELKSKNLKVSSFDLARLDITVNAQRLYVLASANSTSAVGGTVNEYQAYATKNGRILSYGLVSNQASVSAESNGQIETQATNQLIIQAQKGGKVYYKGSGTVQKQSTDVGSVVKVG
jgi:hypothetical protein